MRLEPHKRLRVATDRNARTVERLVQRTKELADRKAAVESQFQNTFKVMLDGAQGNAPGGDQATQG